MSAEKFIEDMTKLAHEGLKTGEPVILQPQALLLLTGIASSALQFVRLPADLNQSTSARARKRLDVALEQIGEMQRQVKEPTEKKFEKTFSAEKKEKDKDDAESTPKN